MAALLHPVIALLLLLRGVPGALTRAPLNEAVGPLVPSQMRATYLSLQSLVGRLSYAAVLVGLSFLIGEVADHDGLQRITLAAIVPCVLGLLVLLVWRPSVEEQAT